MVAHRLRIRYAVGMETESNTQTRAAVAVVTESGYSIGLADENVKGYTPTTYSYESYDEAKAAADLWNERAGLTPLRAAHIALSTMSLRR